jgi:hypothetical protein
LAYGCLLFAVPTSSAGPSFQQNEASQTSHPSSSFLQAGRKGKRDELTADLLATEYSEITAAGGKGGDGGM